MMGSLGQQLNGQLQLSHELTGFIYILDVPLAGRVSWVKLGTAQRRSSLVIAKCLNARCLHVAASMMVCGVQLGNVPPRLFEARIRSGGGSFNSAVYGTESQASAFIGAHVAKGTVLHVDEAGSWENLHERFEVKRINHQEAYSQDGACTNWAEEHFCRLRRAEVSLQNYIERAYLLRYAQESS
jgi:hypothetical protein